MMTIRQQNMNKLPDELYNKGTLKHLVEGNACVLLDGRRTPGIIESIDESSGMFIWRIKDFEDKGKFWELPFEDIRKFQFLDDVKINPPHVIEEYEAIINEKQHHLSINIDENQREISIKRILEIKQDIIHWLDKHSLYFESHQAIDCTIKEGEELLAKDIQKYMEWKQLLYLENETANQFCLNPNSGELIKGMMICLAELGLAEYHGYDIRKQETFQSNHSKALRKKYLMHRIAFVQAMFEKASINDVVVYRGMTSEKQFLSMKRSLISTTFSLSTAKAFFDDSNDQKIKSSYLLKLIIPTNQLLMTYLETSQLNMQYLEQEAIILNFNKLPF